MPEVTVWFGAAGETTLHLQTFAENLLPRDMPLSRPSAWSLILARAYARHLCREHGAASAEIVRHSRNPILPTTLFMVDQLPPNTFQELVCSFGEYRLEN
jgi:hypothetical protein